MPIPQLERKTKTYGEINSVTKNVEEPNFNNKNFNKNKMFHKIKQKLKQIWQKIGWKKLIITFFGLGLLMFIGGSIFIAILSKELPDPNKLSERQVSESTKIYDKTGDNLLYEIYQNQKRTLVEIEDISPQAINATIAVEDKHFYEHKGIRLLSIMRAGFNNLIGRTAGAGGASTLTQQLIKKIIVGEEHSYYRKIKEAILAIRLEKKYTKDQILKLYLNEIPYGSTNYGIEAASQSYFHKSASELELQESATLAALIQAPSRYLNDLETLRGRRDTILRLMFEQEYITEAEKNKAQQIELEIYKNSGILEAPHFVLYVKQLLAEQFGEKLVETGGLKVITTLDYKKQKIAEKVVEEVSKINAEENDANNAALVAIDPRTGQILSMVGSRDFYDDEIDGQYNVAVLGKRQPGSSLKPFIYTAAFEKGYTPDTVLYDVETDFEKRQNEGYIPKNYDGKERGLVTIRTALQGSLNIPAVKTMYLVGVKETVDFAKKFGYSTLSEDAGLSLVLGGSEVILLEHTNAYATLANRGTSFTPSSILEIQDKDGNTLYEWKPERGEKAVDTEIADTITNVLSDNEAREYAFGLYNNLTLGDRPVAVKTGTTNDNKDAWTLGYTPSLAVGVWCGNTTPSSMKGGGHTLAGPIWKNFMLQALEGTPTEEFTAPPTNDAQKPILRGSDGGIKIEINKMTGRIAVSSTPERLKITKTYLQPHTILHYVAKDDPRGPAPENPSDDSQYEAWEEALQSWVKKEAENGNEISFTEAPLEYDNPELMGELPKLEITYPQDGQLINTQNINFKINASAPRGVKRAVYKLDGTYIGVRRESPFDLDYNNKTLYKGKHNLEVFIEDDVGNQTTKVIKFYILEKPIEKEIEIPPVETVVENTDPNLKWIDSEYLELVASDYPRKFYLTPNQYDGFEKIEIYLTTPDKDFKRLIYTFTSGIEKLENGKLNFIWNNTPVEGDSTLEAVGIIKDKDNISSTLTVSVK